jgi:hypothetical protein
LQFNLVDSHGKHLGCTAGEASATVSYFGVMHVGDMATLQVDMVNKTATCGPGVRDITSKLPDGLLFPCGHCNGVPLGGYLKMLGGGFGAPQNASCFFAFVELIYF